MLIKEGKWYKGWRNITFSILNGACFIIGLAILGCGTYATVQHIIDQYNSGTVGGSFSCTA